MKIAYFTESLPPNTDGVVKTLCRLVDSLESEKVDYTFFSPVKPSASYPWTHRVKKIFSIPFFLYKDYKMALPYFHGIEATLDQFKPDLIHIVSPTFLGLYGLNYARKRFIPAVSSYHTHFVSYFSYFGLQNFEKLGWDFLQWFHNRCEATYAPSPSAVQELVSKGIQSVELWQRGIETDLFSPNFRSEELRASIGAADIPILLFVGRLISHKDLNDLVDAHQILKQKGHRFKTVLIGDGPMREELQEKLPDAHFTGFQYGCDLSKWYASADIFAFPSTTETFGNVILEAFASGIPAVGVKKGGVADLIHHGRDGLLAEPHSPIDFADKLETLITQPDYMKQLGAEARESASHFSWQAINSKLLTSYQTVVDRSVWMRSMHMFRN